MRLGQAIGQCTRQENTSDFCVLLEQPDVDMKASDVMSTPGKNEPVPGDIPEETLVQACVVTWSFIVLEMTTGGEMTNRTRQQHHGLNFMLIFCLRSSGKHIQRP